MIESDNPIHKIKNIKKLARKIIILHEEYMDKTRYLTWSKKKRKFILKKFKKR
jgi:hypothetical protein